jgi:KDO2-lipid IV(A) lauroyltransferase
MLCIDSAYFPRLLRLPIEGVALYEGVEHLRSAAALGRGVLVFSGHFGHWELIALLQPRLGVPMTMVAKPLRSASFDDFLNRMRALSGNKVLPARDAVRGVLRSLRRGEAVALLIDQNVRGEGGIFVDFFGVTASTTPALAILAFKSGAPIVPVFSYLDPGGRLRVRYCEPILPERQGQLADDIELLTQRCTGILEDEIRRRPGHWLWMHNRWRTRPLPQARRSCGKVGGAAPVSEGVGGISTKEVSST